MDEKAFADELRKWWSFDDGQQHTHSWHSREDFIEKKLPGLLDQVYQRGLYDGHNGVAPRRAAKL